MKDIILPSETSDAIDLGAINEDTNGIIIPYKDEDAVGYIAYTCGGSYPWALFNVIDNSIIAKDALNNEYSSESLANLVNRIIKDGVADTFKLINFTIALDNYNPDKLSSDAKKLMNKKSIWSL
nr:MAG TPA: hypothetical protein [Crassvirales sp.]